MTDPLPLLPEFSNPPVIEVALSIHFEALPAFRTAHLGLLWERFKLRFPRTEEHPPVEPTIERFGLPGQSALGVQVELVSSLPVPRIWFLNDEGTELIQVQQNFFARNWRRVIGDEEYPRFEHVRAAFERELNELRDFLADEKLGEVAPKQCEITYINHIGRSAGWERHGQLDRVLTIWRPHYSEPFPPGPDDEPEDVRLAVRYVIRDTQREPLGRLYINVEPGIQISNAEPVLRLSLTARGKPDGDGFEGVRRFMDVGHEWIVRGFVAITTPEMHTSWGRDHAR